MNVECGAYFKKGAGIRMGDNSGIGINCTIPNGYMIGKNVMGPNCYIHNRNHHFDRTDIPMGQQGYKERKSVIIGDDVWIGQGVTLMVGRTIFDGTVVAACSVVTKDFPAYSVIGGNPVMFINLRK